MVFPNPLGKYKPCKEEKIAVVTQCFCQNGHSLINKESTFHEFSGIEIMLRSGMHTSRLFLSPIYGDPTQVLIGWQPPSQSLSAFYCPECGEELPVYTQCSCGAPVYSLFLDDSGFRNCIGICSRNRCFNSLLIDDLSHIGQRKSKIQQGR